MSEYQQTAILLVDLDREIPAHRAEAERLGLPFAVVSEGRGQAIAVVAPQPASEYGPEERDGVGRMGDFAEYLRALGDGSHWLEWQATTWGWRGWDGIGGNGERIEGWPL